MFSKAALEGIVLLENFLSTNRTVNIWNNLKNAVVDVDSVYLFKSRLDNLWMFQDVKINTLSILPVPRRSI